MGNSTIKSKFLHKCLMTLGTNNSSQIATAVLAGFKIIFIPMATAMDKKASSEQKKYTMTRDIITESLAVTTYLGITAIVQKLFTSPICSRFYKSKAKLLEKGKLGNLSTKILTPEELDFLKNVNSKYIEEVGKNSLSLSENKKAVSPAAIEHVKKLDGIIGKINKELIKAKGEVGQRGKSLIKDMTNAINPLSQIPTAKNAFKNTRISISQVSIWILALTIIPGLCNVIITPVMKKFVNKDDKKEENITNVATVAPQNTVQPLGIQKNKEVKPAKNYYNMPNLGNMRVC